MVFRPMKLDTGFTQYQVARPEPEVEDTAPNPLLEVAEFAGTLASPINSIEYVRKRADVWQAAFRMENDVLNAADWIARSARQYEPDPTFDVVAALKEDGLWNDYSDNFIGVASRAEYDDIAGKIAQEDRDRLTLSAAGTSGLIAQMAAGLVSPTALLPFVGQARGIKAVGLGVAFGFAGGALQEAPLQLNQLTRSANESVSSIAMSTVLGGVLGGAAAFARKPSNELAEIFARGEVDMAGTPGIQAIPRVSSAGAQANPNTGPLALASALGLENNVGQISPVVRQLTSQWQQARWMMAQLADAGLEFTGSRAAAVGGNVENRIKTYYGPVDRTLRSLDDAYARYQFGQGANKPFAVQRANLAGLNPNRVRMSRQEFKEAIARAMQNNDQHEVPEVAEMASMIRKDIYEPLYKRAQEMGMFKTLEEGESGVVGDFSYLNRVYDISMIQARQGEFEEIIASHYERKLVDQFRASFSRLQTTQNNAAERIADFRRSPEDVKKLREQFEEQLKQLNDGRDAELVELEDAISDKRSAARAFDRGTPEREAALEEARSLESEGGEALAQTREARAAIRRRLANLRRAHAAVTERQAKKLDKIARAEELSFATLQRLVRKGQKVLKELAVVSDTKLDAEISKLKNQFADAAARYERNEDRIATIFDDEFEGDIPTSPFVQAAKVETQAFDKMTDVSEVLEAAEAYNRDAARDMIQAMMDEATKRAQRIVERRAVRNERLTEQARQLDPDAAAKRITQVEEDMRLRNTEFLEQWRQRGADDIDPATGAGNFKRYAADMARTTTNKILGVYARLPGYDILLEPRGAELARVLDIDSRLLVSQSDAKSFLELDAEKLMMMYVRTLAPDIELTRAFGPDFLGKQIDTPDGKVAINENWKKFDDEAVAFKQFVQDQMRAGINPDTGKPKTYTLEQIDKRGQEISRDYEKGRRDIEAVIGRLRHTWGLPQDPRGLGARAAKIASNVNTLRFMSNVTISSIPDIARPIQKYGLLKTFRNGFVPFIRGLKDLKLTQRQLRLAGAALDVTLHSRAAQVYDIGDYMVRGSKFEKGLEYATSKIGLVGLFDLWTAGMKQISGSIVNVQAMDALSVVAGGAKANAKDLAEATRFLAANGIDDDYALRIWKQVESGGGEQVNGVWWANTEDWTDPEAVTAFNAMLVREVDNTIITPGVERPLFTDANPFMRLLTQFKSFGMSSTTKTVLAGAQRMRQGDMAFVHGGLISLALGALSYYIYANIVGGTVKDKMEAALANGEWEVFADEAINRSGLLGIGADLQSAFAAGGLSISGERSSRRGGSNLSETLLGPTFGDLLNTGTDIATGAVEPTAATVRQVRSLLPLQNHFLLRKFYDLIEEGATEIANIPERRS